MMANLDWHTKNKLFQLKKKKTFHNKNKQTKVIYIQPTKLRKIQEAIFHAEERNKHSQVPRDIHSFSY